MNEIIEQISKVLTEAGVEHYCDPNIIKWTTKCYGPFKFPDGKTYYKIYNRRKYTIVSYYFDADWLSITTPESYHPVKYLKNMG